MFTVWNRDARARVLTGCLIALCPLAAMSTPAADEASNTNVPPGCDHGVGGPGSPGHFGPPGPHGMGEPPGPFGGPGGFDAEGGHPPPYLHELKLTEEQQDKVFATVHAAEPEMRDAAKAAHKAHDALQDAGSSPQYSDRVVASLVQAQVTADSRMMLLRIKTEHDIYLILTTEQRNKIANLKKEQGAHGPDHPPR